jgi:tetratricopeptide (TPR) repeat protein
VALYRERALARAKLDRHAEAVEDYGRALEAGPGDEERAVLHLSRGQEYLALEAPQPALRDFEAALRLQPDNPDTCLGSAHARVKLGDLAKGVAEAEKAVKDYPKEPRHWHEAARVYALAARLVKAEPGRERELARGRRPYQQRALALLRQALFVLPAAQRRAYWRDHMSKDPALVSLLETPEFATQVAPLIAPQR